MTWRDTWRSVFSDDPPMPSSREESVQDVLARLVAGRKCAWFDAYPPTEQGRAFLAALWGHAFGTPNGTPDWFVSEYDLPVPSELRGEFRYGSRCADLACGDGTRLLIVELKTERGSYRADQVPDYLRLARRRTPQHSIDLVLLGPSLPGYRPTVDPQQRYTELTWASVPELLTAAFPDNPTADALARYLTLDLVTEAAAASPAQPSQHASEPSPAADVDVVTTAVEHALRMAPSVARARRGDSTERGIDVGLGSAELVDAAARATRAALADGGWADTVTVWTWRHPRSGGRPLTEAGAATGVELRLAPKITGRGSS